MVVVRWGLIGRDGCEDSAPATLVRYPVEWILGLVLFGFISRLVQSAILDSIFHHLIRKQIHRNASKSGTDEIQIGGWQYTGFSRDVKVHPAITIFKKLKEKKY